MASSIVLKSSAYDGRYLELVCTQTKDTASNKSTINWTLYSKGGNVNYYSTGPTTVTINRIAVYNKTDTTKWDSYEFPAAKGSVSGSLVIDHNDDGSKTIAVSLKTAIYNTGSPNTQSTNWELDTIPRGATFISCPTTFSNASLPTITYTNPLGNNATKLEVCIADSEGWYALAPYRDLVKSGTSYTFKAEDMVLLNGKVAQNSTTLGVMFVIRTTTADGNVHTDWRTSTYKMVETDDTKPSVTMSLSVVNPSSFPTTLAGLYVQGKSRIQVSLTSTCKYGATASTYSAIVGGVMDSSKTSPVTTRVVTVSGDNVEVIGRVTDSRGIPGQVSGTIKVYAYSKPLVEPISGEKAILCYRSDASGNQKATSTSVRIMAKRSFYSLSGSNLCQMQWRRRKTSEAWDDSKHKWADLIPSAAPASYEYNGIVANDFSATNSYVVQIRATDSLGEYDRKEFEIPTREVPLHLGNGGKNVSIGEYCDYSEEHTFRSSWKAIFDNGIYGTLNGTIAQQPVSDMFAFAEGCAQGFTPFFTSGGTTNVPSEGNYLYASGFVSKRSDSQITIVIFSYYSGDLAINTYYDTAGGWLGWRYLHTTTT